MNIAETNRKRKRILLIRLNDKEYNEINVKISETGLTKREFIYKAIIGAQIYKLHQVDGVEEEIRKIGVNINQIAKKINSTNKVQEQELKKILEAMKSVWLLLRQLEAGPH